MSKTNKIDWSHNTEKIRVFTRYIVTPSGRTFYKACLEVREEFKHDYEAEKQCKELLKILEDYKNIREGDNE